MKRFSIYLSYLLEVPNFAKMNLFINIFKGFWPYNVVFRPEEPLKNKTCLVKYFSMTAPYKCILDQTFGSGMMTFFSNS